MERESNNSPQFDVVDPEHQDVAWVPSESDPTVVFAELGHQDPRVDDARPRLVGHKFHLAGERVGIAIVIT